MILHGTSPWHLLDLMVSYLYDGTISYVLTMPRACPVEYHARSYPGSTAAPADATGLSRGVSRSLLHGLDDGASQITVGHCPLVI